MYAHEFERIGKRLFAEHLVGGNFGNISIRHNQAGFYIKRTGAYLDSATEPVLVPLDGDVPPEASSEYRVHRDVYRKTRHLAIVHAHPPAAVALSLVLDKIHPEDSEGIMFCPVIPVVSGEPGSQAIADAVSDALISSKLVIARGHGTFAAGKTLDEAYLFTSLCEHACRVLAIKRGFSCE
ncbi:MULTISPECIES: aldolase [unclassified Methanoregula]|uniref:aldolase n=1 Tax=unclassified Methanoregula TaxID=2649730 RepID=UPI0009C44ECA|nr:MULTISPECIES: aldolase [unclassified Methanoregula]OPX65161.1 MAG: L-fuculose phosphate aldolase [Methanoregula sp. PtaB.Bin085]OPY32073.1 MAG: L-fuculose phosphate aldolase [Methanoregula sp. PtaU1.Bin006]